MYLSLWSTVRYVEGHFNVVIPLYFSRGVLCSHVGRLWIEAESQTLKKRNSNLTKARKYGDKSTIDQREAAGQAFLPDSHSLVNKSTCLPNR